MNAKVVFGITLLLIIIGSMLRSEVATVIGWLTAPVVGLFLLLSSADSAEEN
tara:strand:- start:35115 stop:35270 length:156 start_codon:yes stop_codon:yes gene_type:complete